MFWILLLLLGFFALCFGLSYLFDWFKFRKIKNEPTTGDSAFVKGLRNLKSKNGSDYRIYRYIRSHFNLYLLHKDVCDQILGYSFSDKYNI